MRATLATLLAVAGISGVQAQVYACDGLQYPDYDSCDRVMALIPWNDGPDGENGHIPDGVCQSFSELADAGNCVIQACNFRGDGATQPLNVFSGPTSYGLIKQWCKPDNLGGQAPATGSWIVKAVNNPNYSPPSAAKRAAQGKLASWPMTKEESEAFVERAKQVNAERLTNDTIHKRQSSFTLLGSSKNIRKTDERSRLSAVAGSGSQQQWSTTEGYSTSVTTSAEMGVNLFEIFTASVSISVTQEYSVSYTETLVFDPSGRCDQNQDAVLYFYPLFDQYVGIFDGDSTEYTIWVPVDGSNNYSIDVECLG